MFEQTVSVSLTCPAHPEFTPLEDAPTKKCRCCQVISNIHDWLRMADRAATKMKDKFYSSDATPDVPMAQIEDIADVAGEPEQARTPTDGTGTAKKRAISTMVDKAPPTLIGGQVPRVRRKL